MTKKETFKVGDTCPHCNRHKLTSETWDNIKLLSCPACGVGNYDQEFKSDYNTNKQEAAQ